MPQYEQILFVSIDGVFVELIRDHNDRAWDMTVWGKKHYPRVYRNIPYAMVDRIIALAHKVNYQISMLSLQEG